MQRQPHKLLLRVCLLAVRRDVCSFGWCGGVGELITSLFPHLREVAEDSLLAFHTALACYSSSQAEQVIDRVGLPRRPSGLGIRQDHFDAETLT